MAKSKVSKYHHDHCGYKGAHGRVRKMWGSASQYDCIRCEGEAESWAYDHADPQEKCELERFPDGGKPYSVWPEFYVPMCWPCHTLFDIANAKSGGQAIA
jgi:hypothetical protein